MIRRGTDPARPAGPAHQAAIAVVSGTAERMPMAPTTVRTTSTAMCSSLIARSRRWIWSASSTMIGSADPR